MSLVPKKHKTIGGQSLEVTRTYLQRGQAASHSLWIKLSPRHPPLKIVIASPMAALLLTMLVLILIMLGVTLLAIILMGAIWRIQRVNPLPGARS